MVALVISVASCAMGNRDKHSAIVTNGWDFPSTPLRIPVNGYITPSAIISPLNLATRLESLGGVTRCAIPLHVQDHRARSISCPENRRPARSMFDMAYSLHRPRRRCDILRCASAILAIPDVSFCTNTCHPSRKCFESESPGIRACKHICPLGIEVN